MGEPSDIEKLHARARQEAVFSGRAQDADDFAQWRVLKHLEGMRIGQSMKHSLIDYLREVYGGRYSHWVYVGFDHVNIVYCTMSEAQEEVQAIDRLIEELKGVEQQVFFLHYKQGVNVTAISTEMGLPRHEVSGMLDSIHAKIRRMFKQPSRS